MSDHIYSALLERFATFEIIDAHEHLRVEENRLAQPVDFFLLFSQYTKNDLFSSGMTPAQWQFIHNHEEPLDKRWKVFEPFLERIRFCSYARPAFIAAKEYCGVDDINADTYVLISEMLAAHNTPGIYDRLLREKCGIRRAITCRPLPQPIGQPILASLTPMASFTMKFHSREEVERNAAEIGLKVAAFEDYEALIRRAIAMGVERGDVGLKMGALPYGKPDRRKAEALFTRVWNGARLSAEELQPLFDCLVDEMLETAREFDRPVAVHTGVWGDFRTLRATGMIPVVQRHPEVRFDLFHASMPYVREIAFIAKNFPNVWLNLCWSHIVSPMMTRSALNEWIDIVPANKIIAFGADYVLPVEKVYGHLVMARENIAHVLAGRIGEGLMTFDQATGLARKWFLDNPASFYGV